MDDLARFDPDIHWTIAAWLLAAASWMGISRTATRLQRALCATTLALALSTIAEGVALPEVLLLMLWVVLATLLRWLAPSPRRDAAGRAASDPTRPPRVQSPG